MAGHRKRSTVTFITKTRIPFQFVSIVDYSMEFCRAGTDVQPCIIIGNRNSGLESKMFKLFSGTHHMPIGSGNFWWVWNNQLSGMIWQGLQAQSDGNWDELVHWYLTSPIIVGEKWALTLVLLLHMWKVLSHIFLTSSLMWFHDCIKKPCPPQICALKIQIGTLFHSSLSFYTYLYR